MLLGAGALTKKIMNARTRRRNKSRVGKGLTGLFAAGVTGGAIRYFTDAINGPRRRDKVSAVLGKVRRKDTNEWDNDGSVDENRFQVHESAPAETNPTSAGA